MSDAVDGTLLPTNPYDFNTVKREGNNTVGFIANDNADIFAFKYINPDKSTGLQCLIEIDILSRLQHPHIIHAANILTSHNHQIDGIAIILPLAERTLSDVRKRDSKYKLPIFYKLASALAFLHRNKILHLNINSNNVVLQGDTPYFSDFSHAVIGDNIYCQETKVALDHRPPEILAGSKIYNSAVDVWSFGVMMLSSFADQNVYPADYASIPSEVLGQTALSIFTGPLDRYLVGISDKYRPLCKDLLTKILQVDPSKRLTAAEIVHHPLFDDIRVKELENYGTVIEPTILPKFTSDHRDIIKIMVLWAKSLYGDCNAEVLFLAVDLFNRVSSVYYDRTPMERMTIAASCLWVAPKLIGEKIVPLNAYVASVVETIKDVTAERILEIELELVHNLRGVLNASKLYHACKTAEGLKLSLYHVLLARDQTTYAEIDIDSWADVMRWQPGNSSKDVTVIELLS